MMKHFSRFMALLLVFCTLLTGISAEGLTNDTQTQAVYGKTTTSGVRVRKNASTSADTWFNLPIDTVCEVTEQKDAGGIHWYKVVANNPESSKSDRTYVGYIHGDFFRLLTEAETTAYLEQKQQQSVTATPAAFVTPGANTDAEDGTIGTLTSSGVNLREGPSTSDRSLLKLNKGDTVTVLTIPTIKDSNNWYQVLYKNQEGYIQAPFLKVTTGGAVVTATLAPGTTATPEPTATPTPEATQLPYQYARLIKTSCHLRQTPAGSFDSQNDWEGMGTLLPLNGVSQKVKGYNWYPVLKEGVTYYVREDCVILVNDEGQTPSSATPTPTVTSSLTTIYGYIKTIKKGCNLRQTIAGEAIAQLGSGLVLAYIKEPQTARGYTWYLVQTDGKIGYLRSDVVAICDEQGNLITAAPAETITPSPTTTSSTPTATPTATPASGICGYVCTTKGGCNLRATAAGTTVTQVAKNRILPYLMQPITKNGYKWYYVQVDGLRGYLRSDVVRLCDEQGSSVTASPYATPDPSTTYVEYVQTTMDKVYLRATAGKSGAVKGQVAKGTVMGYSKTSMVSGKTWYCVKYNGDNLWILGSCVKVMTRAEYDAYIASHTVTPEPVVETGYVKTIVGGVNLRFTAGGSTILGQLAKNTIMVYSGSPTVLKGQMWYKVIHPTYGTGYILSSCLVICQQDGSPTPTPAVTPTPTPSTAQEASYTTLKLGSSGTAVKNLVTELKNQGYYTGEIISNYTSAVQAAVFAFQAAKNLTQDGIAGSATQHALYGTVPIGSGDKNNLSITLYAAEKIDWWTGGINTLWSKGSNYKIYDVKTGIVWWAHRWSGGYHVDAEPLTAADTARLCKIYGVSTAQQIADKNLYQKRPCLVTIGTRTFACSLYGIPHNYPDGDTISTNNFKGQLCIHFTNSWTHGTKKISSEHQSAIDYAWKNAPNGHK